MSSKISRIKKEIFEAINLSFENTSLHGISNIAQAKYISVRITWLICFISSVGICGWYLFKTIVSFLSYTTVTNIQINNMFYLPFPIS